MTASDPAAAVLAERSAVAATLEVVGPAAPTLAGSWSALDVAAHLVSLDRLHGLPTFLGRTIVARGVRLNDSLGRFAETGFRRERDRGFGNLTAALRGSPPSLLQRESIVGVGLVEVFVHHEDIRRANGLPPRASPHELSAAIPWLLRYQQRRLGEVALLVETDSGGRHRAGNGRTEVRLAGDVGEVVLWLAGRRIVSNAQLTGDADGLNFLDAARIAI